MSAKPPLLKSLPPTDEAADLKILRRKNFLAPLDVKLNVLNTCASASLTYGCEVWGGAKIPKLEALYRQGLKTALSVSNNVNNEIVYFETGAWPLQIRISKQQLKF